MATISNNSSTKAPTLLLFPAPPRPSSLVALDAAYRAPLTAVLTRLKNPTKSATLVIAVTCPILDGPSPRAKSVRWTEAQSVLAALYTLVSSICASKSIDVDVSAGPGSVDFRIVLVDHEPSRKYWPGPDGDYEPNRTSILDLATFASKAQRWETIFHPSTEAGYKLLSDYLNFAEKQKYIFQQLIAVEGGITMVAGTSDTVTDQPKLASTTCLGGTFDHLHPGHKLLLHATVLLLDIPKGDSGKTCTLIVGISGDELLVNKKYAEELQSWNERAQNVLSFLCTLLELKTTTTVPPTISKPSELVATLRNGTVQVRCVNIHDPFGPTITEESMDVLVVSAETRGGGKAINDRRTEKGWHPLKVYEIDVLDARGMDEGSEAKAEDFSAKISSTTIREQRAAAKREP
ncbi:hypothetical protein B0J13DRAFT_61394 [Dactylonectria estremocensis]|uniref:Cytidyltransferase-like domain-containing protein n=1 Tax=Dactylonectria estremocensis TaxID=1079267 RepID=A0A9P9ELP4_9HYPO|nr:hypothetical protein B0J13DRAFT_61394 [Dactylonectria estremocensis]